MWPFETMLDVIHTVWFTAHAQTAHSVNTSDVTAWVCFARHAQTARLAPRDHHRGCNRHNILFFIFKFIGAAQTGLQHIRAESTTWFPAQAQTPQCAKKAACVVRIVTPALRLP